MLPSGFMLNGRYGLSVMINVSVCECVMTHDATEIYVFSCRWLTDVSLLEHTQWPHKDIHICVFV